MSTDLYEVPVKDVAMTLTVLAEDANGKRQPLQITLHGRPTGDNGILHLRMTTEAEEVYSGDSDISIHSWNVLKEFDLVMNLRDYEVVNP